MLVHISQAGQVKKTERLEFVFCVMSLWAFAGFETWLGLCEWPSTNRKTLGYALFINIVYYKKNSPSFDWESHKKYKDEVCKLIPYFSEEFKFILFTPTIRYINIACDVWIYLSQYKVEEIVNWLINARVIYIKLKDSKRVFFNMWINYYSWKVNIELQQVFYTNFVEIHL